MFAVNNNSEIWLGNNLLFFCRFLLIGLVYHFCLVHWIVITWEVPGHITQYVQSLNTCKDMNGNSTKCILPT